MVPANTLAVVASIFHDQFSSSLGITRAFPGDLDKINKANNRSPQFTQRSLASDVRAIILRSRALSSHGLAYLCAIPISHGFVPKPRLEW